MLPALGLTGAATPEAPGVSRQMLHKRCGNGPAIWLAMQQAHGLWQAERDLSAQVPAIPTVRTA